MKLLILSLFLLICSQQILTLQTSTNVRSKSLKLSNPVLLSGDVNAGASEICRKAFPDGKLNPASSYYLNDGCTVACLIGIDEWHKLLNQIGNPCPFNMRGICDTYGRCHNEGPVQLGELSILVDQANLENLKQDDQNYFLVAHIRNSSEPVPFESMDHGDSVAQCITPTMPGPVAVWRYTCDNLSSYLFKDTARIFIYVYAHRAQDPYNNVLVGRTSATIFEILQSSKDAEFQLEDLPNRVVLWLIIDFTPKKFVQSQ